MRLAAKKRFSVEDARRAGEEIGIDWVAASFDLEQLCRGMNVELEHGLRDPLTNVTDDDPVTTAKIALAHLARTPNYYTRLERIENGVAEAQMPTLQTEPSEEAAESAETRHPPRVASPARGDEIVIHWRLVQLLRAGYDQADAERLARRTEVDLHFAINLVRRGCPPRVAQRILL
jgi:Protein of unknown function (DUF5661)